MIGSFADRDTEALWLGENAARIDPRVHEAARRKLVVLDSATSLEDLRVPWGNHLELLKGDRKGQHSIGVNIRWRICFRWEEQGPQDVEIVDYH